MSPTPLWIAEADVVRLMDVPGALRALETGLLAEARGGAVNMAKTHVAWNQATLHAVGAAFPDDGMVGTKTWAHTPGGATPLLILYDAGTGALLSVIEAFAMGQLRTGAASGLATRALAAEGADELAIIGTGKQLLAQIAAVQAVRPLRRVRVFGRDPERRRRAVEAARSGLGVDVVGVESVADAVRDVPIITTVTRAREAFLLADMVAGGAHINAVGAIVPAGAEVASDVLRRCSRIVADSPEQARRLSRELIQFLDKDDADGGGWQRVRRLADVLAAGERRTPSDDLTLFKALGMGISDLSLGIQIYRAACRSGVGKAFEPPQPAALRLRSERE